MPLILHGIPVKTYVNINMFRIVPTGALFGAERIILRESWD